jgi:uncharacterized protein YjiS (DUF1127 family)
MSATAIVRPRPGPFRAIHQWMRRQNAIRHSRSVLHTLSDRNLRDIGIDRGAIDGFIAGAIDRAGRIR